MKMFVKSEFGEAQPRPIRGAPLCPWACEANGLTFPQVIVLQETAHNPTGALGVAAHFLLYLVPGQLILPAEARLGSSSAELSSVTALPVPLGPAHGTCFPCRDNPGMCVSLHRVHGA